MPCKAEVACRETQTLREAGEKALGIFADHQVDVCAIHMSRANLSSPH